MPKKTTKQKAVKAPLLIPYCINQSGFQWLLLSTQNDFTHFGDDCCISAEYENQYGHIRKFTKEELPTFITPIK